MLTADNFTLLLDENEILSRWAEHFNALLNNQSVVSNEDLQDIPQQPTLVELDHPHNRAEVTKTIKQQSSGKLMAHREFHRKYANAAVHTW